MITIRIGFILFSIVSYANAGFMNSVSKEITKFVKPGSTRSEKFLPLLKDLEKDENVKTGEEFEIALATERLGFVYCDVKQEPFMGRFVKEYLKISQGHSAILQTLVPRRVVQAEIQRLILACRNYLQDDVLRDNGLRFMDLKEHLQLIQAVERVIQFDYFSAKPHKFVALQCPIKMDNHPAAKVTTIFFSALGNTDDENKKDGKRKMDDETKQNKDGIGRPYYVFADFTQRDKSRFKILMRTIQQDPHRGPADRSPARAEGIKSRICDNPERCLIRLHVKPERFDDGFRLFGKDAEAAFLTEKLRFFNKSYRPNIIHRFLDTVMEMKKDYEIVSYYEWLSTITEDKSGDVSIFETAVPLDCPKYVKGAASLRKYGPVLPADDPRNVKFIKPVRINIRLKITETSLTRHFYPCPVTFTREHFGAATVNVLPVTYKSPIKCMEHAFYYIVVNKGRPDEYRDFFFSRVGGPETRVNVAESAGIVESATVGGPVEGTEAGAGIEPVGRLVPVEGTGGEKSDENVSPVGVSDSVEGGEFASHAQAGDAKAVENVESARSEDLSGSIRGLEPHSNDGGDEADVSDIASSFGISGELKRASN